MKEPTFDEKCALNEAFAREYEAGMASAKHGFYETCFVAMHRAYAEYLNGTLPSIKHYSKSELEAMRFKGN